MVFIPRRVYWLILAIGVIVAAILVIAFDQSKTSPPTSSAPQYKDVQAELVQAGYHMTKEAKHRSAEASRMVTDEWWQRTEEPETIILSDDISTAPGVFTINAITFTGADGNGNLTCQPNTNKSSPLADLIADSNEVRLGVHSGTIKPGPHGDFPYFGRFVGCTP